MASADEDVQRLRNHIGNLEAELASLKRRLTKAESPAIAENEETTSLSEQSAILPNQAKPVPEQGKLGPATARDSPRWPLLQDEYKRYGRQMITPEVGLQGQLRLKGSSVLIVGIGGLGCPAAAYLAGAGVGTLGLVDGDTVETSNLHRQVLHNTRRVGMSKVDSATEFLQDLNPNIKYNLHHEHLTAYTAPAILAQYDLILDCTDHPKSRYLISDAAVLLGKPLVSASALRTEGQLMTLNNPPNPPGDLSGGPCYRCIFPKPPPAESVVSCGDGGILGPVVGVMGVLQALEGMRLITAGLHSTVETNGFKNEPQEQLQVPALLLFSAYGSPQFRSVRLRSRRPHCIACSKSATVTLKSLLSGSLDYAQFCGALQPQNLLRRNERISAEDFQALRRKPGSQYTLVDVREKVQFDICHLDGSVNVPFSDLMAGKALPRPTTAETKSVEPAWLHQSNDLNTPIYFVCRLGNDSQMAVRKLKEAGLDNGGNRYIGDVKGGFKAWKASHINKVV
ncbi:MAG: Urmylation protein [Pleopsidium flavum]|nr:MAG: Urmylation protein [Pleopsidium flavum]KAI9878336.1 MAG: Urmylation protein [Pleopsidium flavum]